MPLGIDLAADFRISLAGAQEKTALLSYKGLWCRPAGATPTSHIIKLPIGQFSRTGIDLSTSIENEWLCLRILQAFGVPVAKVLVVERFDRKWAEDGSWLMRLPQEDMCQATGTSGSLKYESDGGPGMLTIMDVLMGSLRSREDRWTFMKSQVIFWMLAAIDGHAKNFSIFHLPGGLYRHYRWDMISRRHWLETAGKCRFSSEDMVDILKECCEKTSPVIEQVS